jgi:hypothetical protein
MLLVLPLSLSFTNTYLVQSKNYEVPQCVIFYISLHLRHQNSRTRTLKYSQQLGRLKDHKTQIIIIIIIIIIIKIAGIRKREL